MIAGLSNVVEMIRNNPYVNVAVYTSNPRGKDADPCLKITDADSPDMLADAFQREMSYRSTGTMYWIKLYKDRNSGQIIENFTVESAPAPGHKTDEAHAINGPSAPAPIIPVNADMIEANVRMKAEIEILNAEITRLKGQIVDLEEELDELDDDDEDGDDTALTTLLTGLFGKTMNTDSLAGNNDVISAFTEIKRIAPEAEAVIIKLGELAQTNPDQLKSFITQVHEGLKS